MVLKHNAIEIVHGRMKVAHRTKCYRQNGSLFGHDQRFFAISHPAHYDIAAEHAWILPFVPLCFSLETLVGWLLVVSIYRRMNAPQVGLEPSSD